MVSILSLIHIFDDKANPPAPSRTTLDSPPPWED